MHSTSILSSRQVRWFRHCPNRPLFPPHLPVGAELSHVSSLSRLCTPQFLFLWYRAAEGASVRPSASQLPPYRRETGARCSRCAPFSSCERINYPHCLRDAVTDQQSVLGSAPTSLSGNWMQGMNVKHKHSISKQFTHWSSLSLWMGVGACFSSSWS